MVFTNQDIITCDIRYKMVSQILSLPSALDLALGKEV